VFLTEILLDAAHTTFYCQCAQGLLRFRHPNIALLYGYCLSDSQRKGEYLLYELAEKGSLDTFWSSQLGRERLTLFGRRAQIALDAFIGLRFLHVGNKYIKPCFHRDIKSANIVLKKDMTAQLIDCGLATFSQTEGAGQVNMSTGVKGTRGYVCPKYCTGSMSYDASCDVFSFGIVLAELWSGQLQNHRDANGRVYNFYEQYINEGRSMDDDLDKAFGFGVGDKIPVVMNEYKHLALDCMAKSPKKRPSGEDVMDRLEIIWHSFHNVSDESEAADDDAESDSREKSEGESGSEESEDDSFLPEEQGGSDNVAVNTSGEDTVFETDKSHTSYDSHNQEGKAASSIPSAQDYAGAQGEHRLGAVPKEADSVQEDDDASSEGETLGEGTVGDSTINDSLAAPPSPISRSNSPIHAPTCRLCRTYTADESCEECLMCLALQDERDIIAKAVSSELDAGTLAVQDFHYPHHVQVDKSLPFTAHIDLRLNNPIPRLFGIVPEALKGGWKHPKTWLRRQVATRYNLFFICAHTFQVVRPPIKLTVSSAWIEKIALSLGVSLTLMQLAAKQLEELDDHSGTHGLDLDQLNEMLGEVENILKEQGQGLHILECIRSGIRLSDKDVSMLNGEAYELICEKAREDRDWRRVMEPVRKEGSPNILWVSRIVAMDPESEYDSINV